MRHLYSFYTDAFWISVKSILEHKLRAFLTLLGVIIGVAAVVVVGASISGLKTYVIDRVSKVLGANHFMMTRMANMGRISDEEFEKRNRRNKDIVWEEYEYIRDNCKLCSEVGAQMNAGAEINQDGIEMPSVRIQGVTANMVDSEDKTIGLGRFFTNSEVERSAKVCVIGTDVQEKFFPNQNPIGRTIKVRGVPLQIVGVEEKRGSFFGDSMDRNIYMPITMHNQIFSRNGGLQVHGKAPNAEIFKEAIENARLVLRNKRQLIGSEEDNFSVVNTDEFNSQMDQFTNAIAVVVMPITFITLVVGGIVVMNIMLVSVTERTKEIGIRKAIGATKGAIVLQFLLEAMTLTFFGGVVGVVLAVAISNLIMLLVPSLPAIIELWAIGLALAISIGICFIFGVLPARKASKLDPIECLRYE